MPANSRWELIRGLKGYVVGRFIRNGRVFFEKLDVLASGPCLNAEKTVPCPCQKSKFIQHVASIFYRLYYPESKFGYDKKERKKNLAKTVE